MNPLSIAPPENFRLDAFQNFIAVVKPSAIHNQRKKNKMSDCSGSYVKRMEQRKKPSGKTKTHGFRSRDLTCDCIHQSRTDTAPCCHSTQKFGYLKSRMNCNSFEQWALLRMINLASWTYLATQAVGIPVQRVAFRYSAVTRNTTHSHFHDHSFACLFIFRSLE